MVNSGLKPRQRIPRSQKTEEWIKRNGEYYRDACQPAVDEAEAMKMYRLANGELDETDYLYVTNPINTKRQELMGYPAKLRNYDIISPNVQLIMGEKNKRFYPPIVYARNHDYESVQTNHYKQLLVGELQKRFVNESMAMGVPLEEEEIVNTLDTIARKVKSIPDQLSKQGQDALEYIIDYNDLPRNFRKGFYDWLCNGMVYSYKDVIKDRTYYEIISPINVSYLCSPHHDFIEDGEAVKVSHRLSVGEIYDRFQDAEGFSKELKEYLDNHSVSTDDGMNNNYYYSRSDIDVRAAQGELWRNLFGKYPEDNYDSGIDVEHIQWRGATKIGRVVVPNLFGESEIIWVDETFKDPLNQFEVEWEWVDEIYEVYIIDDHYFVGGRPIPIQRGESNRPNKAKLLYNGRNFFARHTKPTSIVKKGEAYQKSVNIVKYRAEESLLKSLDKIILFPLGLIPKKEGWDEAKLMYYVRAFSFLFFDDTRPNASAMVQALKDLDMSMSQHVLKAYELVQSIKAEYDEVCGINRQRKAQISASDGKAVSEYALNQSYTMSEELFVEFEEFEQRDYTGLLELSKYAFVGGIQSQFVKRDGTKAMLNIFDPDSYVNSDFGVFVRNSAREQEKLNTLKMNLQPFIQNGGDPKSISKLIAAENYSAVHEIMDELDEKMESIRQQNASMEQEAVAAQERIKDKELEFKYYDSDLKSYTAIQVELIDEGIAIMQNMTKLQEQGGSSEAVASEREKLENNAIELMKNATKLKEIASKERMNKDNNETALKNKTVGEK
jgi:hypothetical protein